tara:strand:- start:258 stop:584 length:327 start_codon:yes stop_codon:yes gene_type:complete
MEKYKNQDGISLNYTGKDVHSKLVREVVMEAIKILSTYQLNSSQSMMWAMQQCEEFLRVNFNLRRKHEFERSNEWKINQYNRNRSIEDQVDTIEEMEQQVKDTFDEME